jgi:mannose-6-phosphate isomerase-like protein (cupin superfamily)
MRRIFKAIIPAAFVAFTIGVNPQTMKSDHCSPPQLLERAKHLQQLAAQGDGSASETLEKYPHHYTMLAFRSRSGGAELHQDFADLFYILDGHATVATGGEMVEAKTTSPGEIRGTSVKGGTTQDLKAGDVVHIPAGMTHQMLVANGESVTYFVVKIQENR